MDGCLRKKMQLTVHKLLSVLDLISRSRCQLEKENADRAPDLQAIEEQTCTSQDEIPNAAISKVEMESVRRCCLR